MNHFHCSNSQEMHLKTNLAYNDEFRTVLNGLDGEESLEEINIGNGKKSRLSVDQVQALERIFQVDNKLDSERKIKVAQELGLHPRQVAIWFQNRRARWKTKQLEKEFNLLKSNYEALKLDYNKMVQEKEGLVAELKSLKEKLKEENAEPHHFVAKGCSFLSPDLSIVFKNHNHEVQECINFSESGILNEDNNLNAVPLISKLTSCSTLDGIMVEPSGFPFSSHLCRHPAAAAAAMAMNPYQQQFVKMEEEQIPFHAEEEPHHFFSADQGPFFWYFPERRNQ